MTLNGCASSNVAPNKPIQASDTCPWLPEDIREEAKKYTDIPADELTKADVLNLFRKYATAEQRKNLTIKRVANLYDACVKEVKYKK